MRRSDTLLTVAGTTLAVAFAGIVVAAGYQQYRQASVTAEVHSVLQSVAMSELAALASASKYTECPGGAYPRPVPDPSPHAWTSPSHPGAACWATLVAAPATVRFVYRVVAGGPGDAVPAPPKSGATMPVPTGPWYVAMASADLDGDGVQSSFWVTSFTPGVGAIDPGE
jgi:hypothetical protein